MKYFSPFFFSIVVYCGAVQSVYGTLVLFSPDMSVSYTIVM
ncbi:MAG: hypothetical protein ACE5DM_03080 [Candidatus Nanoarchaeia archaeon]